MGKFFKKYWFAIVLLYLAASNCGLYFGWIRYWKLDGSNQPVHLWQQAAASLLITISAPMLVIIAVVALSFISDTLGSLFYKNTRKGR